MRGLDHRLRNLDGRRPSRALVLGLAAGLAASGCSGGDSTTGRAAEPPAASSATASTGAPPEPGSGEGSASPSAEAPAVERRPGSPSVVAGDLEVPWGLGFLPDGSALVTERDSGRVLHVPADGGSATEVGTVDLDDTGEGGLLGLAVSPDFAQDRWVYVYRSASDGNEVLRFRYDESADDGGVGSAEPVVTGIPHAAIHNGGRLAFGPDGMLYVATGDSSEEGLAQDVDSLAGKVLRVRPDGSVPGDNPFPGSAVWTYGHRNVQGLAWDDDGVLYATEFGQNTFDEVNRLEAGANYGWPVVEGAGGGDAYTDPVLTWRPSEASPSGAAVGGDALYVAALRGERLWRVPLTGDGAVAQPEPFLRGDLGRLRTVVQAPDGALWLTTSNRDGRGDGDLPDVVARVPLEPA